MSEIREQLLSKIKNFEIGEDENDQSVYLDSCFPNEVFEDLADELLTLINQGVRDALESVKGIKFAEGYENAQYYRGRNHEVEDLNQRIDAKIKELG